MRAPFPRFLPTSACLLVLIDVSCGSTPPVNPPAASLAWHSYRNPVAGYAVDVPEAYAVQEGHGGKDVLFRYHGYPVVALNFIDEDEGKHRGLWPGHPASGTAELGGRPARIYVYRHYDGPSFMRTVSYVTGHRGREMGVEFRTENSTLDEVQERILGSFRFE